MQRSTIRTHLRSAAVTAAGLAVAVTATACGTAARQPATANGKTATLASGQYSYYRAMMGSYGNGMMGGTSGRMMGAAGYRWMTGTGRAPGWMAGGRLPGYMMGGQADPGKIMGRFWAGAPGPRVSPALATRAGSQVPASAQVNRAARTVTFSTATVQLTVLASPRGGPDETFRIAGMVNPTVIVRAGARVRIEVINADTDTAHGMVITASTPQGLGSWMPMMTARPAFAGSALWFLGNPTSAGMHAGTLAFTASRPGTYRYLCAIPGHARRGMTGRFIVTTS